MFDILAIAVGTGVAKHLLGVWLGEGMPNTIGGELVSALAGKLGGQRQARQAQRQIEAIRDAVIEDLESFLRSESGAATSLERVAEALGATLETAPTSALVSGRFKARAVARGLARTCPAARETLDLRDQGLYDRALEATAKALCAIAAELPNFHTEVAAAQLQTLDRLAANVDRILNELRTIKTDVEAIRDRPAREAQGFEATYRKALRHKVAELRLFGLERREDAGGELDLEIAYIPLRLQHTNDRLPIDLDYPEILALLPALGNRLLIEGAAGSGKSTLLQWTALQALDAPSEGGEPEPSAEAVLRRIADRLLHVMVRSPREPVTLPPILAELGFELSADASGMPDLKVRTGKILTRSASLTRAGHPINAMPWWQRLPIFLRLRDCPDGKLPSPNNLPKIAAHAAGNPPEAWLRKKLVAGEALLLIDGIDEVPEASRRRLHKSLEDYATTYPDALLVVTSRPAAIRAERWARSFRHRLAVEPMSPADIEAFIEKWHEALAARRPKNPPETDVVGLTRQVLETPALAQLAETPLLCAAICYLHRIKRGEIPRRAARLYGAIAEQLVHQLDVERLENDGYKRLVPALEGLDLDDKLGLLARLALAMVRDERSSLPRGDAMPPICEGLLALRKDHDPEAVLAALQERSGVLRGASEELVEFSHNALKTYLAARRLAAKSTGQREVIRLAAATSDPDLVLLTAAEASIPYREKLIEALLATTALDQATARRQHILALRCSTEEIDSPSLRERLHALVPAVFPPRDTEEASALAELADRAVPHLPHQPAQDAAWNAASVRCLKRIATPAAGEMLESFLDTDSMAVATELAEVIHPLRIHAVVEACTTPGSVFRFGHQCLFAAIHDLVPLTGRHDIQKLDLSRTAITDSSLAELAAFRNLQELWLVGTQVSNVGLVHLAAVCGLQTLKLSHTQVSDAGLAHLAALTGLQELSLDYMQVTDAGLAHLAEIASLKILSLDRTQVTDAGLAHLVSISGLQNLSLDHTQVTDAGLAHLVSISSLQDLSLDHTQVTDAGLAHLTAITGLQYLSLINTQVTDAGLAHLAAITGLQTLWLVGTQVDPGHETLKALRARGVDTHP